MVTREQTDEDIWLGLGRDWTGRRDEQTRASRPDAADELMEECGPGQWRVVHGRSREMKPRHERER
jgi:hypothetical protein